MFNYNDLKKSKDGMPTWDSFVPIVLSVMYDGGHWTSKVLMKIVIEQIQGLPNELLNVKYKDTYSQTVLVNRAGFALSLIRNAGLVNSPKRGVNILTEAGIKFYETHGLLADEKKVSSLPAYQNHVAKRDANRVNKINHDTTMIDTVITGSSPEEQMFNIEQTINDEVATELLSRILEQDPSFFESLVLNLLIKMGYQGKNGDSIVTKRSGDGGIDGIINQDPLGTQTVYIQAKRYKDGNNISSSAIRDFIGALALNNSGKGVFITTSDFTKDALDSAERGNIILINGARLVQLMLQYKIGVRVKETFELLAIDEDFFEL